MRSGKSRDVTVVAALLLLAAVLRGYGLDGGMWVDEIVTLTRFVRLPLTEILTSAPKPNNHTLYSVLAHASVTLFGEAPWTLRLPAYVFGLACIPALYVLGRAVTTRREALLASALLTVSYHHVWFSQNARGYTALLLCTLLTTVFLLRGLEGGRAWGPGYAVAAALGTYTHLTMAFVVAAHVLICGVLFLQRHRREQRARMSWRPFALAFALTAVLTLVPYAPVLPQLLDPYARGGPMPATTANWQWSLAETWRGLRLGVGLAGVLAAAALAAAGTWSYLRQSRTTFALFVLPGVVVGGAALLLGWPLRPRFFFFLLGYAMLVVVRGATVLGGALARMVSSLSARAPAASTLATVLMAVLIVGSTVALERNYRFPKQDFEGAVRFVESARADGEPVVTPIMSAGVYSAYYGKRWPVIANADALRAARSQKKRVWVLYTFPRAVAAVSPDLMPALRRDCAPVRVFAGTVGDGDIVVCVAPPLDEG